MVDGNEKISPVKEGLWTAPPGTGDKPQLIASRCESCGEILFPRRQMCPNCQRKGLDDIKLSRIGKIYSVTTVMQRPPVYYQGSVPYSFGYVELPEGVRVETLFTGCDPEILEVGMAVELVIEKLYEDDEGDEIMTYKFRPVEA